MKNCKTPRTLSEAEFTVGYPIISPPQKPKEHLSSYFILAIAFIAIIVIWFIR